MENEIDLHTNGATTGTHSIRGMEDVIATVSGYHGSERFKLIKLINYTGASYVGAMTKSTTHLVCWQFEGRKYELAKSFETMIVSHRWFEDCVKAGKRLPERHYLMKSGQKAGPLSCELPVVGEKEKLVTRKKGVVLSDVSNTSKPTRAIKMNTEECTRSDSHLLSENSSPALPTGASYHKFDKSVCCKSSKHIQRSNKFSVEPSSKRLIDVQREESTSYSVSHKRNLCSTVENSKLVGSNRKGRRLVKNNGCRSVLESPLLESGQDILNNLRNQGAAVLSNIERDCSPNGTYNFTTENIDLDCSVEENIPLLQGRNLDDSSCSGEKRNEGHEYVEDSEEYTDGKQELDGKTKRETRLPAPAELSCVICWTDFSSTRGVLPCGHRFCYSCIQSWADHMALRRKVSTCPLCKARFVKITKVDGAVSSDQKIYSQTIPYDSSVDEICVLPDWEISSFLEQSSAVSVCCECRSREPEDLLIQCHLCSSRVVHSYCLDPPLIPWTCNNCRDLRMLYQRDY